MMHMMKTDLKDATESRYRTYPHTHNNTDKYGKTVLTPNPPPPPPLEESGI